jgi:hypothetical protein
LHERAEDLPAFFLGNADPRVAHRALQHHLVRHVLRDDDLDAHFTGVGELHGVADQIQHDLSQTSRIADDGRGHVGSDAAGQFEALLIGARGKQLDAVLDRVADDETARARA